MSGTTAVVIITAILAVCSLIAFIVWTLSRRDRVATTVAPHPVYVTVPQLGCVCGCSCGRHGCLHQLVDSQAQRIDALDTVQAAHDTEIDSLRDEIADLRQDNADIRRTLTDHETRIGAVEHGLRNIIRRFDAFVITGREPASLLGGLLGFIVGIVLGLLFRHYATSSEFVINVVGINPAAQYRFAEAWNNHLLGAVIVTLFGILGGLIGAGIASLFRGLRDNRANRQA